LKTDIVLIDDRAARAAAERERLQIMGTLGILETSFLKGYLKDPTTVFAEFLSYGYIEKRLLNKRLQVIGLPPL